MRVELPGFGEAMRTASLKEVPTAILSRQLAAIRESRGLVGVNFAHAWQSRR